MTEEKFSVSSVEPVDLMGLEIAVIGMAGRFPGANHINEFWENLKNGIESISFFTDRELNEAGIDSQLFNDPKYVKAYGILEDIEYFDSSFFGYNPREADIMDPQIRLFHECAWNALEDAGYCPDTYDGLIGLYAGASSNSLWEVQVQLTGKAEQLGGFAAHHLMNKDFLCMMISYRLNLKGPAVMVQTACSTSLVAIHMACQAILNGECDMALAGGVTIRGLNKSGYLYQEGMIYSPDGHCRGFDATAKGTIGGDGVGLVVLKRLENATADKDHIYAIVKGSAINNDGIRKVAFTAPSIEGQAEAIITAQEMAEMEPESITYIETHGTATELGDPVEIEALKLAFNTDKKEYCAIGSVKTNVGHLDNAAGVAGFIKAVLALYHGCIPPSLHFESPNPKIDFAESPFYVNNRLKEWEPDQGLRRAGVSSFGIGGTNAHVVLEQWPGAQSAESHPYRLILLSARTQDALERSTRNLLDHFNKNPGINLGDTAYTLQVGRKPLKYRRMLVCSSVDEAIETLSTPGSENLHTHVKKNEEQDPPIIFMFPGQGSQYINMGLDLYRSEPIFREEMNLCFEILNPLMGCDVKEILYPSSVSSVSSVAKNKDITQTEIAQPLIFIISYALARLLMNRGIKPYAMVGHSIGEYVAACLSGVFSLETALEIVVIRGQLMQQMPGGSMLSVPLAEKELIPFLDSHKEISLAAVNSMSHCVVSGSDEAIAVFARQLKEQGHETRPLHTSHAFHSKMMDPILKEFENRVARLVLQEKAEIPYISNVTGTWANIKEAASPAYWAAHLRNTVRFCDGLGELLKNSAAVFVEVGPGRTLSTFVRQHENKQPHHNVINLIRHPKEQVTDTYYLLKQVGHLWLYGKTIDWAGFYSEEKPGRIPLPGYPFKGQYYPFSGVRLQVDKNQAAAILRVRDSQAPSQLETGKQADISQWFYVPLWKPAPVNVPPEQPQPQSKYLVLANDSKFTLQLVKHLEQPGREITIAAAGSGFTRPTGNHGQYTLNPEHEEDYHTLLAELESLDRLPQRIIHCWNVTDNQENQDQNNHQAPHLAFYSLLHLARAMGKQDSNAGHHANDRIEIIVLSNGMQAVTGQEVVQPQKALLRGPVQVIPAEYPGINCRSIDIDYPLSHMELLPHLAKTIAAEIAMTNDTPDMYTAYRNNRRWVQTYDPTPLEMKEQDPLVLKEKGVYLITGGLGGIGLVLAEYLARNFKARLVLISRSLFPARDQWEDRLRTSGTKDETAAQIKKIREWEDAGAEVLILSADVADTGQMQTAAACVEERFGKINGIIHAAGVPDGGLILQRTQEMSEAVLAPKVKGTLVLDTLFNNKKPDFMVLCSSISSVLSPVGQAAYCAANAFLDTFASQKAGINGTHTVSINWDTWQEVGMAVKAMEQLSASYTAPGLTGQKVAHPLFDTYSSAGAHQAIYTSMFRPDQQWVLEEHRMLGKAVLPGTAYLEIARAALENHINNSTGTLELQDVFFLAPLIVNDEEEKEIRTTIKKEQDRYTFSITSRAKPGGDQWLEHARGKAQVTPKEQPRTFHPQEIAAGLQGKEMIFHPRDWTGILDKEKDDGRGVMVFGPRWNSLRRAKAGENQAVAYLELPEEFAHDLEFYKLHPALLDMATISSRRFQHHESFYLPFGYRKIKIKNALTRKLFCLARPDKNNLSHEELLTYDVTLTDEQGRELVEIEGYTLKRLNLENRENQSLEEIAAPDTPAPALPGSLENALKDAILPAEGWEVFKRILAAPKRAQFVVSTTNLLARIKQSRSPSGGILPDQSPGEMYSIPTQPRPELSTPYVVPDSETQQQLAHIWQQFLGIEPIGIHDDFFELGGDSLKVMTITARIHKELNIEIPLTEFFNRPTIKKLSLYIESTAGGTTGIPGTYANIAAVEAREYYPLSPGQERLYMLQQMDPASVNLHLPFIFVLEGELNKEKLQQVFSRLIRRHESYRTSFIVVDGQEVQVVQDDIPFEIEYHDLTTLDSETGNKRTPVSLSPSLPELTKTFIRAFDLTRAPLLRVGLIKTDRHKHILMLDIHHIISDGTSIGILIREFMALFQEKELPPLTIQYKDYSQWQNHWLNRENESFKGQQTFWLNQLAGEIPVLNLPTDFPRPDIQNFAGDTYAFTINNQDTAHLKQLAAEQEVSLFTLLLALLNVFTAKITGQEDILLGTQVAGRRHSQLQNIIGVFINTLILRNYPQKEKTFLEFLKETRQQTLNAFENQEYPFEDLVEKRLGKRNLNRNPFFDIMLVWQNWQTGETRIPGLTLKPYEKELKQGALLDLSLYGADRGEHLSFSLEYSTTLFKKETIARFITYLKEIISAVLVNQETKIKDIKISHELGAAKTQIFQEEDDEFGF